jgi:hypothetical protein
MISVTARDVVPWYYMAGIVNAPWALICRIAIALRTLQIRYVT